MHENPALPQPARGSNHAFNMPRCANPEKQLSDSTTCGGGGDGGAEKMQPPFKFLRVHAAALHAGNQATTHTAYLFPLVLLPLLPPIWRRGGEGGKDSACNLGTSLLVSPKHGYEHRMRALRTPLLAHRSRNLPHIEPSTCNSQTRRMNKSVFMGVPLMKAFNSPTHNMLRQDASKWFGGVAEFRL